MKEVNTGGETEAERGGVHATDVSLFLLIQPYTKFLDMGLTRGHTHTHTLRLHTPSASSASVCFHIYPVSVTHTHTHTVKWGGRCMLHLAISLIDAHTHVLLMSNPTGVCVCVCGGGYLNRTGSSVSRDSHTHTHSRILSKLCCFLIYRFQSH